MSLFTLFQKPKVGGLGLAGRDPEDSRDFPVSAILSEPLKAVPLPSQFIVSFYRHLFDDNFKPIPEKCREWIKNQWQRGSCVSQSTSYQKQTAEKRKLSARGHHAYCKMIDGWSGEGTYLRTGQKVLVDYGIPDEETYPEPDPTMSYKEYIDVSKIPQNAKDSMAKNKAGSFFNVGTWDEFMRTMFEKDIPVETGSDWYHGDNKIGKDGIYGPASGDLKGGHAFASIGWVLRNGKTHLVFPNSWGTGWGDNGFFYIPLEQFTRLYSGWISVDIQRTLAEILIKYNGKNIKSQNKPELYRIAGGVKRQYPDELAWWSNDNLFAGGYVVADQEEIDMIPNGEQMKFEYGFRWSAGQIKEMLNLIRGNSARADELFKKYFT